MSQKFIFEHEEEFKQKLQELISNGVKPCDITVLSPYPVHGIDEILQTPPSKLRFFTMQGAILGCIVGMVFPIYTVVAWPINTSGKPDISLLPFCLVSYLHFILFGVLFSLAGFLFLSRLPKGRHIIPQEECSNQFVILVEEGGKA